MSDCCPRCRMDNLRTVTENNGDRRQECPTCGYRRTA